MKMFNDSDDVREWLEPLNWEAFWNETKPFALCLQSRRDCEAQIAAGTIDQAIVLYVLKGMARQEIVQRFKLRPRDRTPWKRRA